MDELNKMKRVCALLKDKCIAATLEYPGFIAIGRLSVGTANATWSVDYTSSEGHNLFGCELQAENAQPIPSDNWQPEVVADAIFYLLEQDKASSCRIETILERYLNLVDQSCGDRDEVITKLLTDLRLYCFKHDISFTGLVHAL